MGQTKNAVVEPKSRDELDDMEMSASVKAENTLNEEADSDSEDIVLPQEELPKNLDATQLYLGEIGYSPLLTAEEELYFARRALRG